MQIYDVIASAQDGQAIANLARQFGVTTEEAEAIVAATVPELVRGIERNTLSRAGLADFVQALGAAPRERILDEPGSFADDRVQQDGFGILGHILGGPSKADNLASRAARATGMSDSLIKMMLPIIAQMLMGALARWLKGGLGDIATRLPGGLPGGNRQQEMPSGSGSREPGYGRGFELPKTDGQRGGFPLPRYEGGPETGGRMEDAPRTPQGSPGQSLPMPGAGRDGDNPFGDLSDILRRRGADSSMGGGLWGTVRGMLGNALGFQSKGIMSWIIRAVVLRYGLSIAKRVLGRALGGR